jgi:predicted dehydrogenase
MGGTHAQCYTLMPNAELVAIASVDEKTGPDLASRTGAKLHAGFDEMVNAETLDMVDLCLPTSMHSEFIIKAARKGLGILVEKPIALSVEEADHVIKEIESAGVTAMVAHLIRFWPEYVVLVDYVEGKPLGEFRSGIFSRITQRRKAGTSWKEWLYSPEMAGSPAFDLLSHDIDFVRMILGEPGGFDAVCTQYSGRIEHLFAVLDFPEGKSASIEIGWDYPLDYPFMMGYRVVFDEGAMEFNSRSQPTLTVYKADGSCETPELPLPEIPDTGTVGNIPLIAPYYSELKYFVDCLEEGRQPDRVPLIESRNSLALDLKIIEKARSRLR